MQAVNAFSDVPVTPTAPPARQLSLLTPTSPVPVVLQGASTYYASRSVGTASVVVAGNTITVSNGVPYPLDSGPGTLISGYSYCGMVGYPAVATPACTGTTRIPSVTPLAQGGYPTAYSTGFAPYNSFGATLTPPVSFGTDPIGTTSACAGPVFCSPGTGTFYNAPTGIWPSLSGVRCASKNLCFAVGGYPGGAALSGFGKPNAVGTFGTVLRSVNAGGFWSARAHTHSAPPSFEAGRQ